MSRGPTGSEERLRRLLVMLPWVIARGEVPVAEVAARFKLSEREVVADLERASMCGVPPYGPEDLVDLFVDEGMIYCGANRLFTRPVRLTAPEAFALVAAGKVALQLPGAQSDGPLATAMGKVEAALGATQLDIDVRRPPLLDDLLAAIESHTELQLVYQRTDDAEPVDRRVLPERVTSDRGLWYLRAWDLLRGERRTFRVDRIDSLTSTTTTFDPRSLPPDDARDGQDWFADPEGFERATLRISPRARWIAERYPIDSATVLADGWTRVVLPVTSDRWLAVLLVRAGADAVVESPQRWLRLAEQRAAGLLERYRSQR
jgi:proteasome accessory factor C